MSKRMSKPAPKGLVSRKRTASAVAVAAVAAVVVSACGSSSGGSSQHERIELEQFEHPGK